MKLKGDLLLGLAKMFLKNWGVPVNGFIVFIYLFVSLFICVYFSVDVWNMHVMCFGTWVEVRGDFAAVGSLLQHLEPGDWNQTIKSLRKCHYPMSLQASREF